VLLLKNQKQFVWNRAYLLSALFISWLIPLINLPIDIIKEIDIPLTFSNVTQGLAPVEALGSHAEPFITPETKTTGFSLWTLYWIGTLLILIKTGWVMVKIGLIRFRSTSVKHNGYRIIEGHRMPSFSLFRWIFIDKEQHQDKELEMILAHEMTHAKQLHALDLIILEFINALIWFNPFLFFYKRSLKECHEFLADNSVLQQGFDFGMYAQSLQADYFNTRGYKLASYFKGSTLKRRLLMATRKRQKLSELKYLIFIPIVFFGLILFSFIPDPIFQNDNNGLLQTNVQNPESSTNIPSISPIRSADLRRVSAYFTTRRVHPVLKVIRAHTGVDYVAPKGAPVIASGSGTIEKIIISRERNGYGTSVLIKHGASLKSFYAHLDQVIVEEGQKVTRGQEIATVGLTGLALSPHLYFEIRGYGTPIDPIKFMRFYWTEQDEMYIGEKSNYQKIINRSTIEEFIKKKKMSFDDNIELDVKNLAIQLVSNTYYLTGRDSLNGKTYAYELAQSDNSLYLSKFHVWQSSESDDITINAFEVEKGKIVASNGGVHSKGIQERSIDKTESVFKKSGRWMVDPKDSTKQAFVGNNRLYFTQLIGLNKE
jgi:hypothetical protein